MAEITPNLERLSLELAFKLRDVVASGGADGDIFSKDQRISYLSRAYATMKRKLSSVKKNIDDIFPEYFTSSKIWLRMSDAVPPVIEIHYTDQGTPVATILPGLNNVKIPLTKVLENKIVQRPIDVYANVSLTTPFDLKWVQLDKVNSENFFATKFGISTVYKPNDANLKYQWSILNNEVVFAGGAAKVDSIEFFLKNPTPKFQLTVAPDMYVLPEYNELLLTIAAYEAMLDLGDQIALAKAQVYNQEIMTQIKLEQYKEEVTDKRDSNRPAEKV